jgi:hypothetical protein
MVQTDEYGILGSEKIVFSGILEQINVCIIIVGRAYTSTWRIKSWIEVLTESQYRYVLSEI